MDIRNIAIIAHVDHGKTTLVDGMLKQTRTFRDNQAEMNQTTILDSNDLEREKGITILAKNTSVFYKDTKINIIDTPGHSDFSGEVERIMNMADGALLIVDSAEGPLPQTQFVLEQAIKQNLKIILVINKIDRKDARPKEVLSETEDLFLKLAKSDHHLDFPVVYSVGREGKAWPSLPDDINGKADLSVLFETILSYIPKPASRQDEPFMMLISNLEFDNFKGTYAIGKVFSGRIRKGMQLTLFDEDSKVQGGVAEGIYTSAGLEWKETEEALSGDIVSVTGFDKAGIGLTLAEQGVGKGLPSIRIGEPTLKVIISTNTSPLSGKEGKYVTARLLEQRLWREKKINIGLSIENNPSGFGFEIAGRGELQLSILIETLRREGYEMQVGKPRVILKKKDGKTLEPFEEVSVTIEEKYAGTVIEEIGKRKAEMLDMETRQDGQTDIKFRISSRNMMGFRSLLMSKTRGSGIVNSKYLGYFPEEEYVPKIRNGVLIAWERGVSSSYALQTVQNRGTAFIGAGTEVYEGMIVGLNKRDDDMDVNVCKTKKLTNMHTENADVAIQLDPPVIMSIEQCLDFLADDELLEVTPVSLRLRKMHLTRLDRVRAKRTE